MFKLNHKSRDIETQEGVRLEDDTIVEKPETKVHDIITWHFDLRSGRSIKGINILNAIYSVGDINIPVAYEIIDKPIQYCDIKTRKVKRISLVTKNNLRVQMLKTSKQNNERNSYVLTDRWYASVKNRHSIKHTFEKDFIMAMKSNRLVALSLQDKHQGGEVRIE